MKMTKARRKLLDAVARSDFDKVRRHARVSAATLYALLAGTRTAPRLDIAHQFFIAYGVTLSDWFEEDGGTNSQQREGVGAKVSA